MQLCEVNEAMSACLRKNCGDKADRLVKGEGNASSPTIMMIGEAPGAEEQQQGRPFVGKAGKNLNSFLGEVGLERREIYVTNAVKIRPEKVSAKGSVSNRPPSSEEIAMFLPFLREEILAVKAKIIVTLGNVPLKCVYQAADSGEKKKPAVGEEHGKPQQVKIGGREFLLFPLYHPASIIYNRGLRDVCAADYAALSRLTKDMADN